MKSIMKNITNKTITLIFDTDEYPYMAINQPSQ